MRTAALVAFVVAGCAAAAAESTAEARGRRPRPRAVAWDARPLPDVLADAARRHERVVVEFSAVW